MNYGKIRSKTNKTKNLYTMNKFFKIFAFLTSVSKSDEETEDEERVKEREPEKSRFLTSPRGHPPS